MLAFDDAHRRHRALREATRNESLRALADLSSTRNIELGLVEVGEEETTAGEKIGSFFEVLRYRVDELSFLDMFFTFERELERLREQISRGSGRRPPTAKRLAEYLRTRDFELADDYLILILERDRLAHGKSASAGPVAPVDLEKQILEGVLSIFAAAPAPNPAP